MHDQPGAHFAGLQLNATLLRNVVREGYTTPTPVQAEAIPPALAEQDVLATAETGSGKTAAFVLPVLQRLMADPRRRTQALVLCPTREIVLQTAEQAEHFARGTGLTSVAIYGGVGYEPQIRALRRGARLIVATPGRLLDHIGRGTLSLGGVSVLVLDEADRMLDMGFLPDVRRILSHVPVERQTLFFSATMPPEIVALADEMMREPVRVAVGRLATPPAAISQSVYPVGYDHKAELLLHLIRAEKDGTLLVFTRTKHRADRLAKQLIRENVRAACIHGNRSQRQREVALDGFRKGIIRVLVATDIAARGLDIQGVTHVINFDLPSVPEDYVHRIGRTARAGAEGAALTLMTPDEVGAVRRIEKVIGRTIERVVLPQFAGAASLSLPSRAPAMAGPHRRTRALSARKPRRGRFERRSRAAEASRA